MEREKIVIGLPTYGQSWTTSGSASQIPTPGSSGTGAGQVIRPSSSLITFQRILDTRTVGHISLVNMYT